MPTVGIETGTDGVSTQISPANPYDKMKNLATRSILNVYNCAGDRTNSVTVLEMEGNINKSRVIAAIVIDRIYEESGRGLGSGFACDPNYHNKPERDLPDASKCVLPQDISSCSNTYEEAFSIINTFDSRIIVERATVDEIFLDLTELVEFIIENEQPYIRYTSSTEYFPGTHVANGKDKNNTDSGSWHYDRVANLYNWLVETCAVKKEHLRLAVGAEITEMLRLEIKEKMHVSSSAGISTNKLLAKLVSSRHKPDQQTIISSDHVFDVYKFTNISVVPGLEGNLGRLLMETYKIKTMHELSALPLNSLVANFPAHAQWIYDRTRGIDTDLVKESNVYASVKVSKSFLTPLNSVENVQNWLNDLCKEIVKRLVEDEFVNSQMFCLMDIDCVCDFQHFIKSFDIVSYNVSRIYESAWSWLRSLNKSTKSDVWWEILCFTSTVRSPSISSLSLTANHLRDSNDMTAKNFNSWMHVKAESLLAGSYSKVGFHEEFSNITNNSSKEVIEVLPHSYKMQEFFPESLDRIPDNELLQYYNINVEKGSNSTKNSAVPRKNAASKKGRKCNPSSEAGLKKISEFFHKIT
uniref:UmuC domain-containing protein n=1 Tax=Syphacia muris TaxID=451379 RepID=A0A0N5A8K8_9BILA